MKPEADDWRMAAETGTARRQEAEDSHAPNVPDWTPASAGISSAIFQEMVDWARQGYPDEACGLLTAARPAEDGGIPSRFLPMKNAAASPYRYLMDPDEQLRVMLEMDDRDEIIWGIFHSHVASKPEPSVTDIGLAFYPEALYLICSLAGQIPEVRGWAIQDGRVGEVVLEVV